MNGDPTKPIVNERDEPYSVKDFVACWVQYRQFSRTKEPRLRDVLEWHNQIQAVELEEILNRSLRLNKWPVIKLMWSLFRDSALKELGEPEGRIEMDRDRAAKSFSSRWEKHDRDSDEALKKIQEDAVRIVQDKEVTFNESILAKVHAHHPEPKDYWSPILDAVKAQKRRAKR